MIPSHLKLARVELFDDLYDEYKEGKSTPAYCANMLGMTANEFLNAVALKDEGKRKMQEPIEPVASTRRKVRTTLNQDMRERVVEARLAGGSNGEIAERFSISEATVTNIFRTYKEGLAFKPEMKEEPKVELEKIVEAKDIGVSYDENYVYIKLPKKQFTKSLLKDLL